MLDKRISEDLDDRGFECAVSFLEARGHEVIFADKLHEGFQIASVSRAEGDCTVFTRVVVRRADLAAGEEPFPPIGDAAGNRAKLETAAASFLAEHDLLGSIRFDEVALCVVSDGRAMARHHVDVMN